MVIAVACVNYQSTQTNNVISFNYYGNKCYVHMLTGFPVFSHFQLYIYQCPFKIIWPVWSILCTPTLKVSRMFCMFSPPLSRSCSTTTMAATRCTLKCCDEEKEDDNLVVCKLTSCLFVCCCVHLSIYMAQFLWEALITRDDGGDTHVVGSQLCQHAFSIIIYSV